MGILKFKNKLHYFMQCYFCQTFGGEELDKQIDDFKLLEAASVQEELLRELQHITQEKNYAATTRFINEYSDKIFDQEETENFINYLYDKLLDRPANTNGEAFGYGTATSFLNKEIASNAVQENFITNSEKIVSWLRDDIERHLVCDASHSYSVGHGFLKNTYYSDLKNSRMILRKDNKCELGFIILTAFPI